MRSISRLGATPGLDLAWRSRRGRRSTASTKQELIRTDLLDQEIPLFQCTYRVCKKYLEDRPEGQISASLWGQDETPPIEDESRPCWQWQSSRYVDREYIEAFGLRNWNADRFRGIRFNIH